MKLLGKLPWVTIIVVLIVALKFYPKIMGFIEKKAPSLANSLQGTQTVTENDTVQ